MRMALVRGSGSLLLHARSLITDKAVTAALFDVLIYHVSDDDADTQKCMHMLGIKCFLMFDIYSRSFSGC